MGKRKRLDNREDNIRMKIRRLEKKLRRRRHRSPSTSSYSSNDEERYALSEPASPTYQSDCDINGQSDYSDYEPSTRSIVVAEVHDRRPSLSPIPPQAGAARAAEPPIAAAPVSPRQDNNEASAESAPVEEPVQLLIPPDILDALGDSKTKEIPLGAKVPEEISKRWGRILTDGLSKEHKQELISKTLIPENFQLLKAPILNQEIAAVITESSRNRDKRLEKAQNQLGIGIAGVTSLMSSLIEGKEIEKVDIVKTLSETGQILLDLHYEHTINRTKLITPILDKKFLSMIQDVKRDTHLFGENLGGTIKATKNAEKSGLQIKKTSFATTSSKKFSPQTGSWRGPPRQQGQRAARPTTSRSRGGAASAPRSAQPPPRTTRNDRSRGPPAQSARPSRH